MKIPYAALDNHLAASDNTLRINLFRTQGPASARHQIAWQAPVSNSFRRAGALWTDKTLEDERGRKRNQRHFEHSALHIVVFAYRLSHRAPTALKGSA